jgi:hypothetical protein
MSLGIDPQYLNNLIHGPTPMFESKKDLMLGVPLHGKKQKDFYKYLCGKNLEQINISTWQRENVYKHISKVEEDNEVIIHPFKSQSLHFSK